jgi:hypothetical protein
MRMTTRTTLSTALGAAAAILLLLGAAAAGGQVSTVPRFGPGTVTVEGTVGVKGDVNVTNEPTVAARQSGPWRVGVDGPITIAPQPLPFVRVGRTYEIRWAEHLSEVVIVRGTQGAWVFVDGPAGKSVAPKWANLALAMSIQER